MQNKLTRSAPFAAALSHEQARQTYAYLGGALSIATRYESLATRRLVQKSDFGKARSVFEFGCGTGHFAFELLAGQLPADAKYTGIDVTPRMVALSQRRLAGFGGRAHVRLSLGEPPQGEKPGSHDRFVSTFVLDLLPDAEINEVLNAAHAMLRHDGLLCLASLAPGQGAISRRVMRLWETIYKTAPRIVGGCRPIQLQSLLASECWHMEHTEVIEPLGIPLEVMVARKR